MAKLLTWLILCFFLTTASAQENGNQIKVKPSGDTSGKTLSNATKPSAEDMKIIAVLEILELMDLVEEIDMMKDFEYVFEEDQNEN